MKQTQIIKSLLLTGIVSLTLASCGGGGGGGGGEAPAGNANNNTQQQEEKVLAPERLTAGMSYELSYYSGGSDRGSITSDNTCVIASLSCTYSYKRISEKVGELSLEYNSGTKNVIRFTFTATDGGTFVRWTDGVESGSGNFSFAGNETNNDSSGNGESAGSSNNNGESGKDLAPDTLPAGKVVNLHSGTGTVSSYTLNSTTSCTSNTGAKLTWEYSVTGDATAEWVTSNALNIPITTKMVFTSATGGTYTRLDASNKVIASGTFNLSDKADAPQEETDKDNASNGVSDNESTGEEAEPDYAPNSRADFSGLILENEFGRTYNFSQMYVSCRDRSGGYNQLLTGGSYTYEKIAPNVFVINITGMAQYEDMPGMGKVLIQARSATLVVGLLNSHAAKIECVETAITNRFNSVSGGTTHESTYEWSSNDYEYRFTK